MQITVGADDDIDVNRLDAIVATVKPAHVPHTINIVRRPASTTAPPPPPLPPGPVDGQGTS